MQENKGMFVGILAHFNPRTGYGFIHKSAENAESGGLFLHVKDCRELTKNDSGEIEISRRRRYFEPSRFMKVVFEIATDGDRDHALWNTYEEWERMSELT